MYFRKKRINQFQFRALSKAFLSIILIFSGTNEILAQSKRELEKRKDQIQKDIDYTNQLLNITKKSKSNSLNHLVTLNRKISYRKELITTISSELHVVDKEIGNVAENIETLDSKLSDLKKQYANMLCYAYKKKGTYSNLMFIFSSNDLNQAFKRMLFLRQISDYRLRQRDMIVSIQDSLNGKKIVLQDVKEDKSKLLKNQESQKSQLDKEKKEQVNVLNSLASKEKKLKNDLKEKQRKQQQLSAKIEEIIKREIEAARAAARKKEAAKATADKSNKKITSSGSAALANTPEAIKLSNDFENNKGRLPWPVERGIISSSFGRHAHPLWKDVYVNNNGIDINSSKGSKARAIFDGKVLTVFMVVDKYAVLIQHGEYFTLYSNLENVFVKKDDKVITKQPIGTVQTNDEEGKTEIHLEIWRGSNKMDPETWIASR